MTKAKAVGAVFVIVFNAVMFVGGVLAVIAMLVESDFLPELQRESTKYLFALGMFTALRYVASTINELSKGE